MVAGKRLLFLFVMAGCMAFVFLASCEPRTEAVAKRLEGRTKTAATSAASVQSGTDLDSWLKAYPTEAAAWKSSSKMLASPSGYGGSIQKERSLAQPEFQVNYKGSAYAVSFKTIRGHVYSWEDISSTKRMTDKTPASCLSCQDARCRGLVQARRLELRPESGEVLL